jgi:nudix-type nucleoside diphosphatase (YffH/AdpP family)
LRKAGRQIATGALAFRGRVAEIIRQQRTFQIQVLKMPPEIIATSTLHQGWCRLLKVRLRAEGAEVEREVEDHGPAVAVLPYDPVRRMALMIRLLRAPVLLTAGLAELLEVPAGLLDESDPAETARREVREETGLHVRELEAVGSVWTSPGVSTERMELYLARYAEADRVDSGGGLASENENITVEEMPLVELWSKVEAREIRDMKTLTLVLLLHAREPQLFSAAASATA